MNRSNLSGAYIAGCDFGGCYLVRANLEYAHFSFCTMTKAIARGAKCHVGRIVELEIPKGSVVFSINGDKCRTNKAIVKRISDSYGLDWDGKTAKSLHRTFSYYVGDKINIKNFNMDYSVECATGIHFFKTLEEARCYALG